MKASIFFGPRPPLSMALVCAALIPFMAGRAAFAQAAANNSDVQEVVKLANARMTDDVIEEYIRNSGKAYNLSSEDVLYLSNQGVSQAVIRAMLQTSSGAPTPQPPISAPPPSFVSSPPPQVLPPGATLPENAPPPELSGVLPPGLNENFGAERGLSPALWVTGSDFLSRLAGASGSVVVPPALAFSSAGMEMSGTSGPGQIMAVQSLNTFSAPFTFTATVSGLGEGGIPFEVYLATPDLRQFLSIGERFSHRDIDRGVWLNYTGSGLPISTLGRKIFDEPRRGLAYNMQISVAPDGIASVRFQSLDGSQLASPHVNLSVGTGPFYVVLAGRDGSAVANWESFRLSVPGAVAVAQIPQTPTFGYFQDQLSPYGKWTPLPELGSAWIPHVALAEPSWRPYVTGGRWVYTDNGWYWQSDYPWGDITFHYGRWLKDDRTGWAWAWVPGYQWAPAYVTWRYDEGDGVAGWAPLPPGARFEPGAGLTFHGEPAVDVDFGLRPDAFVFLDFDHFWEPNLGPFVVSPGRTHEYFDRSIVQNGYHWDHGVFRNDGLGRDRMEHLTHRDIRVADSHELRRTQEREHGIHRAEEHGRFGYTSHRYDNR